jgi:hypothetical protein
MGNYNGTIRCGFCYDEGHNSRTCPQKLERLQKNLESAKADGGNYSDHYARRIAKMTGVNPETGEKASRRSEYRGRICSYCKEGGHNRRTCGTLQSDMTRYATMTRDVRSNVRQWAMEEGVGIGAMIMYKDYYASDASLMMVEAINLQKCHARLPFYEATLRPMNPTVRKQTVTIKPAAERADGSYNASYEIVGKLTPEQIAAQLSEDWVNEGVDFKSLGAELTRNPFEKGEQRVYHYWSDLDKEAGE